MKTNKVKLLLCGMSVAALAPFAAVAADQTGTATATISTAVALTEDTQMAFGEINVDALGGTVTLTPAASISATNANYVFAGTQAAGQFTATGDASQAVTISFSGSNNLTDQGANGGAAMPLQNLQHDAGGSPALNGSGTLTFNVGADLVVGANQVASNYSGSYTVTVNYQ